MKNNTVEWNVVCRYFEGLNKDETALLKELELVQAQKRILVEKLKKNKPRIDDLDDIKGSDQFGYLQAKYEAESNTKEADG